MLMIFLKQKKSTYSLQFQSSGPKFKSRSASKEKKRRNVISYVPKTKRTMHLNLRFAILEFLSPGASLIKQKGMLVFSNVLNKSKNKKE